MINVRPPKLFELQNRRQVVIVNANLRHGVAVSSNTKIPVVEFTETDPRA